MKKHRSLVILLAVVLCAAALFCLLWMQERSSHCELEQLCRYSAYRAYDRFSDYRDDGSLYDYDYGVAELVSFYNSYKNLVTSETGSTDTNCVYLNQLLGILMYKPELNADQKNMLVTISRQLNQNIYDANVYDDIFYLYNQLQS